MPNQERLNQTVNKSVDALLIRQKENGAMDGYCSSRVLESALTLHLLRNQAHYPDKQKLIEDFLIRTMTPNGIENPTGCEPIVTVIVQCVIDHNSLSDSSTSEVLGLLSNREQGRKALYFGCLLAEIGAVSFSSLPFEVDAFQAPRRPVQTWAQVMLYSLKVLYCWGTSAESLVTPEEQDFLKSRLLQTDIFENNILTQIVGLLALSKLLPRDRLESSIATLMEWQQGDGGLPLMTGLDHFVTPLAGLTILDLLPILPVEQQHIAQSAVKRMAKLLASVQASNGGWSFMTGTLQTDMDDSGLCCALLARVNRQRFKSNLQKFHRYLVQMQNKDGGFPTYIESNPSTPSMTAAALHGMVAVVRENPIELPLWKAPIKNALSYLLASQQDDGTFERRWSNAETHTMFRVAITLPLVRQIFDLPDIQNVVAILYQRMASYLYKTQNPDGGWGQTSNDASDVNSTAYAVLCTTHSEKELAAAGVKFLMARQEHDGTFQSRPDLLGPRPLWYEIPLLTTISATYACGYFIRELR